jgi:hypothetical protein
VRIVTLWCCCLCTPAISRWPRRWRSDIRVQTERQIVGLIAAANIPVVRMSVVCGQIAPATKKDTVTLGDTSSNNVAIIHAEFASGSVFMVLFRLDVVASLPDSRGSKANSSNAASKRRSCERAPRVGSEPERSWSGSARIGRWAPRRCDRERPGLHHRGVGAGPRLCRGLSAAPRAARPNDDTTSSP